VLENLEHTTCYSITSKGILHIKQWEYDGLVFVEGPNNTHLVSLTTIHLLNFLAAKPNTGQNEVRSFLTSLLGAPLNEHEFQRLLLTLINIKIIENTA